MTSSSGQTSPSGAHGSSSRVRAARRPATAADRNRTPAQTPSPRAPGVPSRWDSRWVSHRSTPLAGTTTTSWANGSSSGVDSRSPSASASRSVRGARWRWSAIGADPMCGGRQISGGQPAREAARSRSSATRFGLAVVAPVAPHDQAERDDRGGDLGDAGGQATRQPPATPTRGHQSGAGGDLIQSTPHAPSPSAKSDRQQRPSRATRRPWRHRSGRGPGSGRPAAPPTRTAG